MQTFTCSECGHTFDIDSPEPIDTVLLSPCSNCDRRANAYKHTTAA